MCDTKCISFKIGDLIDINDPEIPALAKATIDGYPANPDDEGTVVCNVWMLGTDKFLIDWHQNQYRLDDTVLGLITKAKELMSERAEK